MTLLLLPIFIGACSAATSPYKSVHVALLRGLNVVAPFVTTAAGRGLKERASHLHGLPAISKKNSLSGHCDGAGNERHPRDGAAQYFIFLGSGPDEGDLEQWEEGKHRVRQPDVLRL